MELKSILIATDFSECAGAAFQSAQTLGKQFDAKLIVLHVVNSNFLEKLALHLNEPSESLTQLLRHKAQQTIAAWVQQWRTHELEVDTIVAVGVPFQEIAVLARDLAVDIVVMGGYGHKGRGEIEQVFFGSTAEKVVRLLPCPVLCVPMK